MKFVRYAATAALAAVLALPAMAQTTQVNPATPAAPSITPVPGAPAAKSTATPPSARSTSSALVDINSASESDLDALPGVGKARADAIIKNRPYKGKDDLVNRKVIPPNIYKGISGKIIAKQS